MRGDKKKTPIVGMAERKGRVVARVDAGHQECHLCLAMCGKMCMPETTIFTDEASTYDGSKHMPVAIRTSNQTQRPSLCEGQCPHEHD